MASLTGSTTLLSAANLLLGDRTPWAYVGAATQVSLFIDDGGTAANWTVEVAVGAGGAGLNGIDNRHPQTFTVTSASPAVFTSPLNHGLAIGDDVTLSTTGSLYTGLVAGTVYYVKTVPTARTFTLGTTRSYADYTHAVTVTNAVNTSGAQAGVHSFQPGGDLNSYKYGVLASRIGAAYLIATAGVPLTTSLSPFGAHYIRVSPSANITAGTVRISTVASSSRALRGSQVLWNAATVANGTKSAAGYLGARTTAVLILQGDGAYTVQVSAGTGGAGLNGAPAAAAGTWSALTDAAGTPITFQNLTPTSQAIDLSPVSASYIRLVATGVQSGVTATLVTSD